ncbi:MAG: hypothetical protein J7L55_00330, partial [Desulfurococcales archaeon]|nr:hypothetical protein [Desulfurococcales archaeon]
SAGLIDDYAEVMSKVYRALTLLKAQDSAPQTLHQELMELLDTLKVGGKVMDFRVKATSKAVTAVATAVSEQVAEVIETLLLKHFGGRDDVEVSVERVGQTVTLHTRRRET